MLLLPAASGPYTTRVEGLGKRGCLPLALFVSWIHDVIAYREHSAQLLELSIPTRPLLRQL